MAEFNKKNISVIAVAGPTASGKTSFAISLAKLLDGEIISMDSMQIYKYMDIGTAKPTLEEMDGVKHHLLDVVEPCQPFTASDYAELAKKCIEDISSRGKTPILCGGTGLYLNSVLYAYNMSEASFDEGLRAELEAFAAEQGNKALHDRLRQLDPKSADEIHCNNTKRVIRALEICILTGKPKSEQMESSPEPVYNSLVFGMDIHRDILYDRINRRVDIMVKNGLEDEIRLLLDKGIIDPCDKKMQAAQAIGYKEMYPYFAGEITFDDAVEQIKMNSRRYAKRQLTWFRRLDNICWIDPTDDAAVARAKAMALDHVGSK